eukprot:807752-Rhodomonas_salina.1
MRCMSAGGRPRERLPEGGGAGGREPRGVVDSGATVQDPAHGGACAVSGLDQHRKRQAAGPTAALQSDAHARPSVGARPGSGRMGACAEVAEPP